MSKLSRISDMGNVGKITYEMGVGKPKKGERDCMAVINLLLVLPYQGRKDDLQDTPTQPIPTLSTSLLKAFLNL